MKTTHLMVVAAIVCWCACGVSWAQNAAKGKGPALAVVVEGVEDAAQRDLLSEMGCDTIQGFLYSEGVSAERVPEVLDRINNDA